RYWNRIKVHPCIEKVIQIKAGRNIIGDFLLSEAYSECAFLTPSFLCPSDVVFKTGRSVAVGSVHPKGLRRLMAACPNLTSLAIRDRRTSSYFLRASCPKTKLRKLQRLALNGDGRLTEMGLDKRDLQKMVDALCSLVYVAVDSLEVRLYLDHYAPHVVLGWSTCPFCAAKFPQWNAEHADLWARVHKSLQAGCGESQCNGVK
ncbi:hypothetical protein V5799_023315, partial [Amblyomma americanum]